MIDRTDEETVDLIRSWLRQYGLTIIGGLGLGIAGVLGYQWWQSSQQNQAQEDAQALANLRVAVESGDMAQAKTAYAGLHGSGAIADMGALLFARAHSDAGDYASARTALQKAAQSKDAVIAQSANWQLAQLAAQEGDWDGVLTQVQGLQAGIYAVAAQQLAAQAYRSKNEPEKALAALENAYSRAPDPFLEIQIQTLKAQLLAGES